MLIVYNQSAGKRNDVSGKGKHGAFRGKNALRARECPREGPERRSPQIKVTGAVFLEHPVFRSYFYQSSGIEALAMHLPTQQRKRPLVPNVFTMLMIEPRVLTMSFFILSTALVLIASASSSPLDNSAA